MKNMVLGVLSVLLSFQAISQPTIKLDSPITLISKKNKTIEVNIRYVNPGEYDLLVTNRLESCSPADEDSCVACFSVIQVTEKNATLSIHRGAAVQFRQYIKEPGKTDLGRSKKTKKKGNLLLKANSETGQRYKISLDWLPINPGDTYLLLVNYHVCEVKNGVLSHTGGKISSKMIPLPFK